MNERLHLRKLSGVEILALASLVLLLSFLAYMTLLEIRYDKRLPSGRLRIPTIANNLHILDVAKEAWAMEHHATNGTPVTTADLAPYLKNGELPKPAAGETYTFRPVGELNTATLTQAWGKFEVGQVLTVTSF